MIGLKDYNDKNEYIRTYYGGFHERISYINRKWIDERHFDEEPGATKCANCGFDNSNSEGVSSPGESADRLQLSPGGSDGEITITDLDLTLVPITPDEFLMGSPAMEQERSVDEQQHKVTLTKPYWLGETEVTQAQYEAIMGNNPSHFNGEDRPVEQVSWNDAVEFCRKLTERERRAGRLPDGQVYRLPTEAEWEYACRAGTTTVFHYGESLSSQQANFRGDKPYGGATKGPALGRTTDVASYKPNTWGLYDMHGNVWEWCRDWYGDYLPMRDAVTDPTGADHGTYQVIRGGGWLSYARSCRSAVRLWFTPTYRHVNLGFRLARGAP